LHPRFIIPISRKHARARIGSPIVPRVRYGEERVNLDGIDGIRHHNQQRSVRTQRRIDRLQAQQPGVRVADRLASEESSGEIFEGVQAFVGEHESEHQEQTDGAAPGTGNFVIFGKNRVS
jgi:hypothetical protein